MLRMRFLRLQLMVALCVFGLGDHLVHAQFSDLIRRVPPGANAIIAINLQKALNSPLAKKEGWKQDRQKAFDSGMVLLPPSSDQLLMAAQMDLEYMQPQWEVTLLNVSRKPNLPEVATRWGGTMDNLNGRSAVVLPQDTYIVEFGEVMVGAMTPANRQSVGRWLREIDSNQGGQLSSYLQQAFDYANKGGTPIIMALDLQDVVSPEIAKQRLQNMKCIKDANVDVDQLAKTISTVKGVTLGITINQRVFGRLKVDFSEDCSDLADIAKPLLLEILEKNGSTIDEFYDWKPEVKGNTASIGGYLNRNGLRRLLSFIDSPAAIGETAPPASSGKDPESLTLASSQQYFKSVSTLLDDLREKPKRNEAKTWGQVGGWLDRYSRKIDKLPMVNVDPELLDYGAYVSDTLRRASDSLKNIAGRSRVREVNTVETSGGYAYRGGRWGGYGAYGYGYDRYATQQARTAARTEERVSGTRNARDIMRDIETATSEVRREMVKKYNADF